MRIVISLFQFSVAYLTVRTVAITIIGSRRMEMRMGRRTTEGEAEDISFYFLTKCKKV